MLWFDAVNKSGLNLAFKRVWMRKGIRFINGDGTIIGVDSEIYKPHVVRPSGRIATEDTWAPLTHKEINKLEEENRVPVEVISQAIKHVTEIASDAKTPPNRRGMVVSMPVHDARQMCNLHKDMKPTLSQLMREGKSRVDTIKLEALDLNYNFMDENFINKLDVLIDEATKLRGIL